MLPRWTGESSSAAVLLYLCWRPRGRRRTPVGRPPGALSRCTVCSETRLSEGSKRTATSLRMSSVAHILPGPTLRHPLEGDGGGGMAQHRVRPPAPARRWVGDPRGDDPPPTSYDDDGDGGCAPPRRSPRDDRLRRRARRLRRPFGDAAGRSARLWLCAPLAAVGDLGTRGRYAKRLVRTRVSTIVHQAPAIRARRLVGRTSSASSGAS